jgi:hypothetical protein
MTVLSNKTIDLLEPIEGAGSSKITQVVMRAPKFPDIMSLGEPRAFGRSEGGVMFTSEKEDIVEAYIQRLVIEPKDPALLNQCGLAAPIQLKDAVFDFFEAARQALLKRSLNGSSSSTGS